MQKVRNVIAFGLAVVITVVSCNYAWGAATVSPATQPVTQQVPALSHEAAETLVLQMNATMNSRLPYRVKSFFEYYIQPTAAIHKKSILVSPNDLDNPQSIQEVDYTRDQYIKALGQIVTVRGDYSYEATLNGFEMAQDGASAVLNISIEEISMVRTSDDYTSPPTYIRNFVTTNCNAIVIGGGSVPVITGANCIEKIIFS